MSILDRLPLWATYVLTAGLALLAAELGFRIGAWMTRRDPAEHKGGMTGTVVGAELGLLAFMLAFSLGIAVNNYGTRRQLVVAEANAIGTSYLRADLLAEPDRTAARDLLRQYVDTRVTALDPAQREASIERSEEIQDELWSIVVRQASEHPGSNPVSLFVDSINRLIDVHGERLSAVMGLRLPEIMWVVFYGTTFLTFFLVGFASSSDGKRNLVAWLLLALALSAVLLLIVDYDRPQEGLLTVSQEPLFELQEKMPAMP